LVGSLVGAFTIIGEGIDVQDSAERARDERPGEIFAGTSLAVVVIGAVLLLTSGSRIGSNADLTF
jgi:hypothetical protein